MNASSRSKAAISVAIPTYRRESVLIETLRNVLDLDPAPEEILVVDQTETHEQATASQLAVWDESGAVRWLRRGIPSIPQAMNHALRQARQPIILYLDDDIVPRRDLLACHLDNYTNKDVWAVVGQVLQPGEQPTECNAISRGTGMWRDLEFPFFSTSTCEVHNVMAGNLSVRCEQALGVGGFDENFVGVAYRFETEFSRRLARGGGRIIFAPDASIRHLQAGFGGTRSLGGHLRSPSPSHSVGAYYFAMREGHSWEIATFATRRQFREVRTRFHLTHPWWIPVKLVGEIRGLAWAARLAWQGPRYVSDSGKGESVP